jgi:hypothetical protein
MYSNGLPFWEWGVVVETKKWIEGGRSGMGDVEFKPRVPGSERGYRVAVL